MKKIIIFFILATASGCTLLSKADQGQVVYHWERPQTGVEKFSRDHSECLRNAEDLKFWPDVSSWFYSEEARNEIIVDWHSTRGVWATYVPYRGAQPLIINSLRADEDVNPREYRVCMEDKGYEKRIANIPEITNIFVYNPQRVLEYKPAYRREF